MKLSLVGAAAFVLAGCADTGIRMGKKQGHHSLTLRDTRSGSRGWKSIFTKESGIQLPRDKHGRIRGNTR